MEVLPAAVGAVARSWDEQHADLAAASRQIDGAATNGFPGQVSGAASRFTGAWTRLAADLGADCETRADTLRSAILDYVRTDLFVFHELRG
jgi:hypothetical protein